MKIQKYRIYFRKSSIL